MFIFLETMFYATIRNITLIDVTILYAALCYYMLLYATLCYSTLLYATLLYATLRYFTLLYATQCYSNIPKIRDPNQSQTTANLPPPLPLINLTISTLPAAR
jgi:ABC-type antimicrobial peptide transport system permease subunit